MQKYSNNILIKVSLAPQPHNQQIKKKHYKQNKIHVWDIEMNAHHHTHVTTALSNNINIRATHRFGFKEESLKVSVMRARAYIRTIHPIFSGEQMFWKSKKFLHTYKHICMFIYNSLKKSSVRHRTVQKHTKINIYVLWVCRKYRIHIYGVQARSHFI